MKAILSTALVLFTVGLGAVAGASPEPTNVQRRASDRQEYNVVPVETQPRATRVVHNGSDTYIQNRDLCPKEKDYRCKVETQR